MSNYVGRYRSRDERARFIKENFSFYLTGKILDVGCDRRYLGSLLVGQCEYYVGIDIGGSPDIYVNLEKGVIPVKDNSFDTIIAAGVLEHLDNIHGVFDELCRVPKEYVILSLPNIYEFLGRLSFI